MKLRNYTVPTVRTVASRFAAPIGLLVVAGAVSACGTDFATEDEAIGTVIEFEPNRPDLGDSRELAPYQGTNTFVLEAQSRYRTGLDLHVGIISRTCSPTGGVCHNQKEYPDLHTPSNFVSSIDAPCNAQPGEHESVYDRCELPGDRFTLSELAFNEIEVGYIEYVPGEYTNYRELEDVPDATSTGLHVYLHDPVVTDRQEIYGNGTFVRTFINDSGEVQELPFANYRTRWWVLDDGRHLMAEVQSYQSSQVNELLSVGIEQGDQNRNGVYGAREQRPVPLLAPGNPEESYLIARLRGEMAGEQIPGSRMPLANPPLTIPDMLALFCFVEGLGELDDYDSAMSWDIDYANCSYAVAPEDLNLLGEGVTWQSRIWPVLQANCGGCHSGTRAEAGLDLLADDAYERLLQPSSQNPDMPLIDPGNTANSYLWQKLIGGDGIEGNPMPYNPLTGAGELGAAELGDIETWIANGAVEDQ